MSLVRIITLGVALLFGVTACMPRTFDVDCIGPDAAMGAAECARVADHVAQLVGVESAELGKLMVVSVELVDCWDEEWAQEIPEPDAPRIDRCWRVFLGFERGGVDYIAALDRNTGDVGLYE